MKIKGFRSFHSATKLKNMNTVDSDKTKDDTAIDVDKDANTLKRPAPKRMKDEVKVDDKKVRRNVTIDAFPNDCVAITIATFREMKMQIDEHQVTVQGLQDELSRQRDLVKEYKEIIEEFRDTNEELQEDVKDYKKHLNDATSQMSRLRRHIASGVAAGQSVLGEEYDVFASISDFVSSRRSAD